MDDYKPNSHRFREEQQNTADERQKMQKVVNGQVKTKKNEVRKFADVFLAEDVANVKNYILMDVLVPAIKKAVSDIITNGIDMILYGEIRRDGKPRSIASTVSYRDYYGQRREGDRFAGDNKTRTGYSYDDIILESRTEAEEVLSRLDEAIDLYGVVRVADLYDLVGITGNFTDNKYGWTNIRNAEVVKTRDGYMIKMPRALPINK